MNLSLAPEHGHLAMNLQSTQGAEEASGAGALPGTAPRLGYLTSRYPAVSHTFILREIGQLRESGFEIHSASVNNPDRSTDEMTADEIEEARTTYYLKAHGVLGAFLAHLWGLSRPLSYLRGLVYGLR